MTDRELLEAAAKAAGMPHTYNEFWSGFYIRNPDGSWVPNHHWNPLTDDGDALRLMVSLRMNVHLDSNMVDVDPDGISWFSEAYGADPYAATRRAIVRAAAEIGRSKT
jgi:hypothetical protein